MKLNSWSRAFLGLGLFGVLTVVVACLVVCLRLWAEIKTQADEISALTPSQLALTSEVYARDGQKIGEFAGEQRYFVALNALPKHLIDAFLSAEDKDFYHHGGISPVAILRAMVVNLSGQEVRQGASTITQQVARLAFLDQRKTFERKIKEAFLALVMEHKLSKERILEMYLNKIYLGNHSYGVEAAARNYFRKHATDLSIGEAAILAALPKSPSRYAPHRHPARASERQALILKLMAANGFISSAEARLWTERPIQVAGEQENFQTSAPYFLSAVRNEVSRKFELSELPARGLKIYTTLDVKLQEAAAEAVQTQLSQVKAVNGSSAKANADLQAALISIEPKTGAILALQGGDNYSRTQFDRTQNMRRPLYGVFVPFYVALALDHGYSMDMSAAVNPLDAQPPSLNAANTRRGNLSASLSPSALTLRDLVVSSATLAGSPLALALGIGTVKQFAQGFGLSFGQEDLGIALGLSSASPLELAYGYAVFVNGGKLLSPVLVTKITTDRGRLLYQAPPLYKQILTSALQPHTAQQITEALRQSLSKQLAIPDRTRYRQVGGIATASDDLHDAWYIGVQPRLVSAVWIGSERGLVHLQSSEELAAAAARDLWLRYMHAAPDRYLKESHEATGGPKISLKGRPEASPRPDKAF